MKHRPYPKIAASTMKGRGADLARVERALAASDKMDASVAWVATEKIHGAQFVVATDGTTVAFGKRKAWLLPVEVAGVVAEERLESTRHLLRRAEERADSGRERFGRTPSFVISSFQRQPPVLMATSA